MATYFVSDIHGEYDLFCGLLDHAGLRSGDTLYILGDFLDKGKNCVKLAKLIAATPEIRAIQGNHEHFFLSYYRRMMSLLKKGEDADGVLAALQAYFPEEREPLTWDVVDYIDSLPYYIEKEDLLCVHAGVELDKESRVLPVNRQKTDILLFDRAFAGETAVPKGKTVLFGHTPCNYTNGSGRFIKTLREGRGQGGQNVRIEDFAKIRLDTGVHFTGILGCLRQEDMREFYVKAR